MNQQLSLFPSAKTRLESLIEWSFGVFNSLSTDQEYQLAFSGGKDSHVLLGVYLLWCESRGKRLNVKVVFSDTFLESPKLYELVDLVAQLCNRISIPFVKVHPPIKKNFWVLLVGYGYPVPNHKNRWCTEKLKGEPMRKLKAIGVTGRHTGESTKRDANLKTCGSSECGIDRIKNSVDPLTPWRNCDVWDWLILHSDEVLYQGVSDKLMSLYDISESQSGSLRMGCFMCPVVGRGQIAKQVDDGIIPSFSLAVRDLIEELRVAPRILSQRTGKAGAIQVDARIDFWEKLQPHIPQLRQYGWLSEEVELLVNELLEARSYPPTYKEGWVREQESRATPWLQRKGKKTRSSKYEQLSFL
jgi:DNA sulfur modification protein DndC